MQVQEKLKRLWVALFGTLVIAGCSSTATEPVVEQQPLTEIAEVVEVVEVIEEAGPGFAADNKTPVDASGNPVSRTFYFDFDQAIVSPADFAALSTHAEILRSNPSRSVVVAGHCDQRGTREYNLALGESRAKSISAILVANGVSARQIEEISYGEEELANPANNARAWSQNRRAVVSYR
jgi:peptidoglycan-associated lipoprotein